MKSIFTRIREEDLKYKRVGQKIGCIIIGLDEYNEILRHYIDIIDVQSDPESKYTFKIHGIEICVCDDLGSCFNSYPENNLKDL